MIAHIVPRSIYVAVFAVLGVLLVLTVLVARVDLGIWNTPIALSIAAAKAVLIVLYFMHVRYAPPLVRIAAAGGFFWLAIMFFLAFSDVLTRT